MVVKISLHINSLISNVYNVIPTSLISLYTHTYTYWNKMKNAFFKNADGGFL